MEKLGKQEAITIIEATLSGDNVLDRDSLVRYRCEIDDIWGWDGIIIDKETEEKVSNVSILDHWPELHLDWDCTE